MKKSEIREPKSERKPKLRAPGLAERDGCLVKEISRDFPGARTFFSAKARPAALADKNVRAPFWVWLCRSAFLASPQFVRGEAARIAKVAADRAARCGFRTSDLFRISGFGFRVFPWEAAA